MFTITMAGDVSVRKAIIYVEFLDSKDINKVLWFHLEKTTNIEPYPRGIITKENAIALRDFLTKSLEEYDVCQSQETTAIPKLNGMPKKSE